MTHFLAVAVLIATPLAFGADWSPADGPLRTRWTEQVSPENAWPEYPRPQMVREQWQNLNGLWDYAITASERMSPEAWDGAILVPYPVESMLSGVKRSVSPRQRLWYRRSFEIPKQWQGDRVLLHFGAVDFEAVVWVNGTEVGTHRGGYDPFSFDISAAIRPEGDQEIVVAVWDPTDAGSQPRGKQVLKPQSIWYTPTTGIWQTVWLEPVPRTYIRSVKMITRSASGEVVLRSEVVGDTADGEIKVTLIAAGKTIAGVHGSAGKALTLKVDEPRPWSPSDPFLYDIDIELRAGGKSVDRVRSYVGIREISVKPDDRGVPRLMLNGEPVFQYGPLDQGFWPDGLYTPPTDEAMRYDIEMTKELGFNLIRKHVKVEPDRWYYWCDKLGLLVWQDMPSGDIYISRDSGDAERRPESAKSFMNELVRMIEAFDAHPCIVMWVPFNEGWGQYETAMIAELVNRTDPTRLVNSASGWVDRGVGHVYDMHRYPGPEMPGLEHNRAVVLGEFGGLGLPVKGHTWQDEKNWGYRNLESAEALTSGYQKLVVDLRTLVAHGLSAAVYTQTTDVEIEVNGLMTYDRAMVKPDLQKVRAANLSLYKPLPTIITIAETSELEPQQWRYTFEKPEAQWMQPEFDASSWKTGDGGFGLEKTPNAPNGTKWTSEDIWLRRSFEFGDAGVKQPFLRIHHGQDVIVYLNGQKIANVSGFSTGWRVIPLDAEVVSKALKPGENVLAAECHKTGDRQFIDVGITDIER